MVSGFPFSPFGVSSVLLVSAGREVRCLTHSVRCFVRLRSSFRSSPFFASLVVGSGMQLRRGAVPSLVPCCRLVCVFLIGVSVSAFRLSCRRWRLVPPPRVGVSCRRIDVGVLFVRRLVLVLSCCAVFVSSFSRAVLSVSRRCRRSIRTRPVGCVEWGRVRRRAVGVCGVAVCVVRRLDGVACRGACRGRFDDVVSCGVVCRERGEGRDACRDEGRDDNRAVFVSSIWSFQCFYRSAWGLGEFSAFSTVSKYNTQDGRRMMSSDGIHNTNTNRNGFHYIELMFGVRA